MLGVQNAETNDVDGTIQAAATKKVICLDDFRMILAIAGRACESYIRRNAFHPLDQVNDNIISMGEMAYATLQKYAEQHETPEESNIIALCFDSGEKEYQIPVKIDGEEVACLEEIMQITSAEARLRADLFLRIKKEAYESIDFHVMPNDVLNGARAYLGSAMIIIPPTRTTNGFHVLNLRTNETPEGLHVESFLATDKGEASTPEEAFKKHFDPKPIQTIAYAVGVGNFPLYEAVIPTMTQKYGTRIGSVVGFEREP